MSLRVLEACAHAGLKAVEDTARIGVVPSPFLSDAVFINALTEAQLHDHQALSCHDQDLISALFKDARWLVQTYGHSVAVSVPQFLVTGNHALALQQNADELLRIAAMDDADREKFVDETSLTTAIGIPALLVEIMQDDSVALEWHLSQRKQLEDAQPARGCPALRIPSTIDPSKTMAKYFFDRYVETFATRNIAQATATGMGQIALLK